MVAVRARSSSASRRVTGRTALRRVSGAAITVGLLVCANPAQAYSSQQWALDYLKANQDWQVSKGSNVTVAVIDTGVASIPDLNGQVLSGADFSGGAASSGDGRTDTDNDGHGTGMSSVIAANGTSVEGLAPTAKILPVRVATGTGGFLPANIAAAIRYATSQHTGVINLSIGNQQDLGSDVSSAITEAVAANVIVVASTGNDTASTVDYPAAYPGVVAVGAVDQSGQVWSQSNTGSRVALTAPGVQIYRDNNFGQQGTSSGTSEATAYVSAAAALVRSAHPDWTAGQVIRDLIGTADPGSGQSAGQHSDQYGYGIVDPLKALQTSAPSDTSNPLLSSSTTSATPGSGSTATATAGASAAPASSHTGLIIGVVVGVVVIIGLILLVVALSRRGRGGGPKPPTGPGEYGGYQQQPYPPQTPYQQNPNPYSQQPPQHPQG
jgi:subtilisin family serine protease